MEIRALLRYLLSPWVLLGASGVGLTLFCAALVLLWVTRPAVQPGSAPTAVLQVIPLPTDTPVLPTATPEASQEPTLPAPSDPGNLSIGAYVQVNGTGGDGVRVRSEAGLSGQVLFLGLESEVFLIQDGPRQADGYTWWYLAAPYDQSIRGWAVANYLRVVQQP
jgi:hypothetical protein